MTDNSADNESTDVRPPARPPGLIKRPDSSNEVIVVLGTPPSRVVLRGLGGSGKTWLAIDVANDQAEIPQPVKVIWTSARDHALTFEGFLRVAARQLGSTEAAELQFEDLPDAVLELLAERSVLIVIDNFDTVEPDHQRDILIFLAPSPSDTRVLITSRHTDFLAFPNIGAADWRVVPMRGLSLDETKAVIASEADRVGAPHLKVMTDAVMERIREVTGGLPAAIRWLVAQARRRPLDEVVNGVGSSSEGPGPALIRDSYELLQPDALAVLRPLCVLDGPASPAALAAAADISDTAARAAIKELDDLGLIELRPSGGGGEPLQGVHPLVREFVREALHAESALHDELIRRATNHYIRFLRINGGFQNVAGHDRILRELDAILGLAERAVGRHDWHDALDLIRPLNNLFWMRGLWRERLQFGRMAREAAAQLKDISSEGQILSGDLGWTHRQLDELDDAYMCLSGAVPLLELAGDFYELANAWRYLAQVARDRGDLDHCQLCLGYAVASAEHLDAARQAYSMARIQLDLGYLALERGQLEDAHQAFSAAADVFGQVADQVRRSIALNGLGDIAAQRGDARTAVRNYEESLELARQVQSLADEARALLRLAEGFLQAGDRQAACQYAVEAAEAFQKASLPLDAAGARELVRTIDGGPAMLRIDASTDQVWVRGVAVHLEPQELELLRLLCQHAGEIVTHAQIRDVLFPGSTLFPKELRNRIHPLVSNLRKAIEVNPTRPELLLTRYGKGYLVTVPCADGSQ